MRRVAAGSLAAASWASILLFALSSALWGRQPPQHIQMLVSPERLESMRLITEQTGWLATDHRLLWTTDAGRHWSLITPSMRPMESISSAFFLNTSVGWALLSYAIDDDNGDKDEVGFDLASTKDSGASWTIEHLNVPDPQPDTGLSSDAWVSFSDAIHGWILVRMSTSVATSSGVFLATRDGGKSWKQLDGPPIAGPFEFTTPEQAWLTGGPDDELYRTEDGGKHWRQISVPTPSDSNSTYELPTFRDPQHGLLSVLFESTVDTKRILFSTDDGGRTWEREAELAEGNSARMPDAVTGGVWISCSSAMVHELVLRTFEEATKSNRSITADIGDERLGTVFQIDFPDALHGWVIVSLRDCASAQTWCEELLSTQDGGASWAEITPAQVKPRLLGGAVEPHRW